jgi:hypothetical protein
MAIASDWPESGLYGKNFTAIIMAASAAQIVRTLQFAAIRAFLKRRDAQRVVATTHVALRGRGFSLGDGHVGTCSI